MNDIPKIAPQGEILWRKFDCYINERAVEIFIPFRLEVSNDGQLRNPKNPLEKFIIQKNFYGHSFVWMYDINDKKFRLKIHRLVALNFLPNPQYKHHLKHINGDLSDNSVENLAWCGLDMEGFENDGTKFDTSTTAMRHYYESWNEKVVPLKKERVYKVKIVKEVHRISDETKKLICANYHLKKKYLCDTYGCSISTLYEIFKAGGIELKNKKKIQ